MSFIIPYMFGLATGLVICLLWKLKDEPKKIVKRIIQWRPTQRLT